MKMAANNRDNFSKKEITQAIKNKLGLPISLSTNIIDQTIKVIIESLKKDKIFKIKNFGTFYLREKKSRIGRNPRNLQTYEIKARKTITFKNSKYFKIKLNKYEK